MTNYNDMNWHGWNGGECPVHPKSRVDIAGSWGINRNVLAERVSWTNGVIAFRVVKEHREPREFWLISDNIYASAQEAMAGCDRTGLSFTKVIHVREVLE